MEALGLVAIMVYTLVKSIIDWVKAYKAGRWFVENYPEETHEKFPEWYDGVHKPSMHNCAVIGVFYYSWLKEKDDRRRK